MKHWRASVSDRSSSLLEPDVTTRSKGVVVHESPVQWSQEGRKDSEESIFTVTLDAEENEIPVIAITIEGFSGTTWSYGMYSLAECALGVRISTDY